MRNPVKMYGTAPGNTIWRPTWRPLYASRDVRIDSWSRFISEAYWNVELEE